MKKLPNFVKWIIILAALAAMGWMMWAVNDRASRVEMPSAMLMGWRRIIHSEFITQQIPASKSFGMAAVLRAETMLYRKSKSRDDHTVIPALKLFLIIPARPSRLHWRAGRS